MLKSKGFQWKRATVRRERNSVCMGAERERKKMTEFIVQIYETLNKMLII